jgi:hypothetical protein
MQITPDQAASFRACTPEEWAWEACAVAQAHVYGDPLYPQARPTSLTTPRRSGPTRMSPCN